MSNGIHGTCDLFPETRQLGFKSATIVEVRHRRGRTLPELFGGAAKTLPKKTTYGSEYPFKSLAINFRERKESVSHV